MIFNSKTIAWAKLGELSNGQHGISYIHSTTDFINKRISEIEIVEIEKEICAICHDNFDIKKVKGSIISNNILKLDCNHTFHHSCIRNLLFVYMDDKCPLCRVHFKYKLNKSKKIKKRLKYKIINHFKNDCNRIYSLTLIKLFVFLGMKGIHFNFLTQFALSIKEIGLEKLIEMKYAEITDQHIYMFNYAFCEGDLDYQTACSHTHTYLKHKCIWQH